MTSVLSGDSKEESEIDIIEKNAISRETEWKIIEFNLEFKPWRRIDEYFMRLFSTNKLEVTSKSSHLKGHDVRVFEYIFKCNNSTLKSFPYSYLCKVSVAFRRVPIHIEFGGFVCKNDYSPLIFSDPESNLLISKNFVRTNGILKHGSFSLDPMGMIVFKVFGNYEVSGQYIFQDEQLLGKWFKINYSTMVSTFDVNLPRVLFMANLLTAEQYNQAYRDSNKIKTIPASFEEEQEKIFKVCDMSYKAFGKKRDEQSTATSSTQSTATSARTEDSRINYSPKVPEDAKKTLQATVNKPYFDNFEVQNVRYLQKLSKGAFSDNFLVEVEAKTKNQQTIKNILVAKVPRQDNTAIVSSAEIRNLPEEDYCLKVTQGQKSELNWLAIDDRKIRNEKEVLSEPKNKNFPYIAQYYDDSKGNPAIYMEYYKQSSLDRVLNASTCTLLSKLNWMLQLAQVVNYLNENKISHLDLRLSNILMGKQSMIKVFDFAEGIVRGSSLSPSLTRDLVVPYAPPESIIDAKTVTDKSDVFSVGQTIFTMLTGKSLVGYKRNSNHKLKKLYKNNEVVSLPVMRSMLEMGPNVFMKWIFIIVMSCISPDPTYRLGSDYLVLVLYHLRNLCEKVY